MLAIVVKWYYLQSLLTIIVREDSICYYVLQLFLSCDLRFDSSIIITRPPSSDLRILGSWVRAPGRGVCSPCYLMEYVCMKSFVLPLLFMLRSWLLLAENREALLQKPWKNLRANCVDLNWSTQKMRSSKLVKVDDR